MSSSSSQFAIVAQTTRNETSRSGDLPGLPRILDLRKVIEQQAKPGLG
jgi:hypothetical protein